MRPLSACGILDARQLAELEAKLTEEETAARVKELIEERVQVCV